MTRCALHSFRKREGDDCCPQRGSPTPARSASDCWRRSSAATGRLYSTLPTKTRSCRGRRRCSSAQPRLGGSTRPSSRFSFTLRTRLCWWWQCALSARLATYPVKSWVLHSTPNTHTPRCSQPAADLRAVTGMAAIGSLLFGCFPRSMWWRGMQQRRCAPTRVPRCLRRSPNQPSHGTEEAAPTTRTSPASASTTAPSPPSASGFVRRPPTLSLAGVKHSWGNVGHGTSPRPVFPFLQDAAVCRRQPSVATGQGQGRNLWKGNVRWSATGTRGAVQGGRQGLVARLPGSRLRVGASGRE